MDTAVALRGLNRNLADQVAQRIGEMILAGDYSPGVHLPDEAALSGQFSVSRTVVREAVKMLVSKGMLEVRPRTGTRVLEPPNWQLLDRDVLHWHRSIAIDPQRLSQLMELRQSVEPDAAMYAAQRCNDADREAIGAALTAMETLVDRNNEYVIADARFHTAILRAAHNQYLDALESAIFVGLLLSIRITNPDAGQNARSVPLHRDIAEAIFAGKPAEAYQAMKTHLADSAHRLEAGLKQLAH